MNKFLPMPEFKMGNNKEYKVKAIQNIVIYAKKVNRHPLGVYYLMA